MFFILHVIIKYLQKNIKKHQKVVKSRKNFECKICHYVTSYKKDYHKHLSTRKHKMLINANKW